jgi:chromosome segregation ATPase
LQLYEKVNIINRLNELRAKLESKKTLSKEYNQEIRMLKTKYVTTDKSLTRRLNKSFESESDQQKSLLELLEIEKSKSNALNLKIDKVRMTISKQDEEMVFLRQKHEKLSKQINEVEYKFEAFKEQQSATLLLNEKDTSLGEVRKAYTDKRTEIDTFEKFYIEQLAHFRQAKEEQEERYDTLLKVIS